MGKTFREGATGALLDEYEKAIQEMQDVIADIPDAYLTIIVDTVIRDDNCCSIQNILTHVVYAGFGYATSISNLKKRGSRPPKAFYNSVAEYTKQLSAMFSFTEGILTDFQDSELEESDNQKKILSGWGQVYDVEQMMEHAIVHILRHRRQIEKILLNNS